eukprot:CAMPEP_0206377318 /NCGR_PEP_ID=MMETSP0294-20121207/10084_1 /ASSEMBLY_ACC=CAM_ASM_000327 /TAXON_ID=39354 /ORGANISM="Heterosigma akashiwo, Strain CCMP2393" /LENGTH=120 /DNA_ID=CAMNT_0053825767 /DNA_START=132 /DNA_END=490 /DNA_ORIENTATION=+
MVLELSKKETKSPKKARKTDNVLPAKKKKCYTPKPPKDKNKVQKVVITESPGGPGYRRNQKHTPPSADAKERVFAPPKVRARNWVATLRFTRRTREHVFRYLQRTFASLKALAVGQEELG